MLRLYFLCLLIVVVVSSPIYVSTKKSRTTLPMANDVVKHLIPGTVTELQHRRKTFLDGDQDACKKFLEYGSLSFRWIPECNSDLKL